MTQLDWLILAFASVLAFLGFRQGFVVGLLSFAGFALGAFLGTRIGPLLLSGGSSSPYAPAFGLLGALVAGVVLASGLEGIGFRLRRSLVLSGAGPLDGILGAVLGCAIALGTVWIAAAFVAQSAGQGSLRADIERSAILRRLNEVLPPSGPILGALARLDPIPSLPGQGADVAPPSTASIRSPAVRRAAHSVVRVVGTACGLAIEGSGWVAGPDLVVTNAHVVAGEQDTRVEVAGASPGSRAVPVAFDPTDDLALLRVPQLGLPRLPLAGEPPAGTGGAILGYPENGPLAAAPARIGRTQTVVTDDAYGRGPISRLLTPLRGVVRPGNSGGPVVDDSGEVLTTVFAGTVGAHPRGGYGVANQTLAQILSRTDASGAAVGTGPCVSG
jgi:uncharacterized membrane protein required for colicin V production